MACVAVLVWMLSLHVASAASPPRPLLWKVSDGDNHIYLLGSFHALKAGDYPLAASVSAAVTDSATVAFEVSPAELQSPDLARKMLAAATLPAGETLQTSLSAATWQRLQQYGLKRNMPIADYQRLGPWFVALLISLREMALIGYDAKLGLDQYLIAQASRLGKHTLGLESSDEQISALASMTPAEQEQELAESLDEAEDFKSQIDQLHAYWRNGDDARLDSLMRVRFMHDYPALYQHIDVARNRAWLPKVRRMLDDEHRDNSLVVVGTLHLLGSDGLVSLLRAKGYRVQRL